MTKSIEIRDAHEHNLRHVNLSIPRDSIVVVTGVSGSGRKARGDSWSRSRRMRASSLAA